MSRKFVIGDIHGHYCEMMHLFKTVNLDYDQDLLISLGDLVDRGPKPIEVIEELRKIRNFIHILGNHDDWCYQYLKYGTATIEWTCQGGSEVVAAYNASPALKNIHLGFFEKSRLYYIDEDSRLFVHAGFDWKTRFIDQKENKEILLWDRTLFAAASVYKRYGKRFDEFSEIFIGHTPTQVMRKSIPIHFSNLWMMDTGICHGGKLTIMDIETKKYWQSKRVS